MIYQTQQARHAPLDYHALQRHVLQQMGISLWVNKYTQTQRHQSYCPTDLGDTILGNTTQLSAINQANSDTQAGNDNNTHRNAYSNAYNNNAQPTPQMPQAASPLGNSSRSLPDNHLQSNYLQSNQRQKNTLQNNDLQNNELQNSQLQNKQLPNNHSLSDQQAYHGQVSTPAVSLPAYLQNTHVSVSSFELWGMRYRKWLLLCDAKQLHTATRGVWQALEKALKDNESKLLSLQARYPLMANDYPQYQHYEQGHSVLLGFLLRLCQDCPSHVAYLSTMPAGIDFGGLQAMSVPVPTLDTMYHNPNHKKRLWQLLHDHDAQSATIDIS